MSPNSKPTNTDTMELQDDSPIVHEGHVHESPDESPIDISQDANEPLMTDWNRPIVRPDIDPSSMARLVEARKKTAEAHLQDLHQLISAPPKLFPGDVELTPLTIAENATEQASVAPIDGNAATATNSSQIATESYKSPISPNADATTFNTKLMDQLGIADTKLDNNPIFSLDTVIHNPDDPAELLQVVHADPKELHGDFVRTIDPKQSTEDTNRATTNSPQSDRSVNLSPKVIAREKSEVTSLVEPSSASEITEELIPVEESVEMTWNLQSKKPESVINTDKELTSSEMKAVDSTQREMYEMSTTVQESDVHALASDDLVTFEEEDLKLTMAPVKVDAVSSAPQTNKEEIPAIEKVKLDNTALTELESALEDVPQSSLNVGDIDMTPVEDTNSDATEEEITKDVALKMIAAIQDNAVYGTVDPMEVFDPSDMNLVIDNDTSPSRMVVPLMSRETLEHYVVQSNPNALRRTAGTIFGVNDPFYRTIEEGLGELNTSLMNPDSYINRIHLAHEQSGNAATTFNKDKLRQQIKEFKDSHDGKELKLSRPVKLTGKGPNKTDLIVDDKIADKTALLSKMGTSTKVRIGSASATRVASLLINGVKKVNFFNSGFYTINVSPPLDLLSRYYNTIADKSREYGGLLGQLACFPIGVETRAALLDLWEATVIESNLTDFKEPGILRKALSVLDVPIAAWSMAALMYPRGVDIEYLCYNNIDEKTKCRHAEKIKIDVNAMRYNNWSKLNSDAVIFTDSNDPRDLNGLHLYRTTHLKDTGTVIPITEDGSWSVQLSIPSAYDAEENQRAYINNMAQHIQTSDFKSADEYYRSKYLIAMVPYINSVIYADTDTGKKLEFVEPSAIEMALDNLQLLDNISMPEQLMQYVGDKTISHICFSHNKCPRCGQFPPDAINNLIPCDPEYAFFVWTTAKLRR